MKRICCYACIGLFLLAVTAVLVPGIGIVPVRAQAAPSKDVCLGCHGPYEKLAGSAPAYVAPSGEKINPHVFVPHTSKEAKAVPQCTNCHRPHELPPKAEEIAKQPKPDVGWCYTTCHHRNDFQACKTCHNE
jgi:hypothetical protein